MFAVAAAALAAVFLYYGLDVRNKDSARGFVAPRWQLLMKFCSFALLGSFIWGAWSARQLNATDWLGLAVAASGTAFVVAAKRALGQAHTFTGQYLERPQLVTHGVYAFTRNPLYFGVFQCEAGASLFMVHQAPTLPVPGTAYWLAAAAMALGYAVLFNWRMAVREARHLEGHFGVAYREYAARVPFLVPGFRTSQGTRSTPGTHPPRQRSFRLDAGAAQCAADPWYRGQPLMTRLLEAYTLLVPEGERFVIRTCSHYFRSAEDDLKNELKRLCFQEGQHSRAHAHVLEAMRAEGLGLDSFRKLIEWISYRVLEPLTPWKLRLATAAGIEHHNAVIATYFLNQGLMRGARNAELRRLFLWHFAEEIEHKETAFKLLRRVSRSWPLRALGLTFSVATFLFFLAIGTLLLAAKTGAVRRAAFWRELLKCCCTRAGLLAALIGESARYLRPSFAPTLGESQPLLDSALSELARLAVERPNQRNLCSARPLPEAFRDRVTPVLERVGRLQVDNAYFGACIGGYNGAWVRCGGTQKLNFCTYSYLGLLGHPRIQAAAGAAMERYGTGTHGVRLLGGNLEIHEALEARIAAFFGREAALTFSSGFMTNLAVIAALVGKSDHVLSDERNHASIVDGCRQSGASIWRFKHNDVAELEHRLQRLPDGSRKLIVVDAVYSMDGDIAPLDALLAVRDRYPNTLLMVDEAHSLGVLGSRGRGIEEHCASLGQIDVLMGTLSKTIPAQGGYVAGSRELITFLRFNARGFVFSAALSPATAAAALAALDIIDAEGESRRACLTSNVRYFIRRLRAENFDIGNTASAIVPILLGSEAVAFGMARKCHEAGLHAMPVVFPAVAPGTERLRLNVTCDHRRADLDIAVETLIRARRACEGL
jgi:glycine C-acetyltransferase